MPVAPAHHPPRQVRRPKVWTPADLEQFGERMTPRLEVIDGVLYADGLPVWEENPDFDMAPAPNPIYHQDALGRLYRAVAAWLDDHPGPRVFFAPADVRLPGGRAVEPDLFVVAAADMAPYLAEEDPPAAFEAVPVFVAEVLSPRTASYDRHAKRRLYEEAGVREYWIVDARARRIEQYVLEGERYGEPDVADEGQRVLSVVLDTGGEPFGLDVVRLFEP